MEQFNLLLDKVLKDIYSYWVSMKRNKAPLRERMKELTVKVAI